MRLGQSLGITPVSKTCFTMALPELVTRLRTKHPGVRHILLTGVESHVCVLATCQDFTQMGYTVHVVVDCTSSRSNVDRIYAYEKMKVCNQARYCLERSNLLIYSISENGGLADYCRVCNSLYGGRLEIASVQINSGSDQRKKP